MRPTPPFRPASPPETGPRDRATDVAVAVVTGLIIGAGTLIGMAEVKEADRVPAALGWALIVVACAALAFRRRHPVVVGAVTLLTAGAYYPLMSADGPVVLAFAVALYTAAAEGRAAAAGGLATAALLGTAFGEIATQNRHLNDSTLFLLTGWLIAAIALGSVARSHRAYLREVERRAVDAERGKEEAARRRAVDERLRIARELHDVLGHNISLINVQASAALHRVSRDPASAAEQSEAALVAIKQASKDALRELRATLGLLRQVDELDERTDGTAPVAPVPGVAAIGELADGTSAAGLRVRTEIEGEPRPLPAEVDLTVYRIVQEALTNVARHADAGEALVHIHYDDDEVTVQIDDGRAPSGNAHLAGQALTPVVAQGNGLLGMQERVRALGGRFMAGHRADGGFTVRAGLPLGGAR